MPVFTYSIIAAVVVISFLGFNNNNLINRYDFSIREIFQRNEYYRIITSQFFHVNWAHLIFNMFSFYSFSTIMEYRFGLPVVALIYFASAITGDLLALFMNRKNSLYRAVGASGAVSGIIFSSIFLIPGGSIFIFPIPIALPSWLFAILFVAISIFGIGKEGGNIGHEAHLGGALCGTLLSVLIIPEILYNNTILLVAVILPVTGFLIFFDKIKK